MVYLFGDTDPGYDYFAVGKNKTSLQAFTRLNRMPEYIWPSDSVPYAYGVIPSPFPTSTPAHDISVNFSVNDTGQLAGTYSYNQKAAPVVLDKWMGANAPANIDGDYKIAFSYHTRFDKDGYPTDYQNYIISMSILNGVGSINITTQDDGLTLPAYETKYSYSNFVIDTSSGCLVSFTDTGTSYSGFCLSDSANLYFIVKTDSGIYRVYQF